MRWVRAALSAEVDGPTAGGAAASAEFRERALAGEGWQFPPAPSPVPAGPDGQEPALLWVPAVLYPVVNDAHQVEEVVRIQKYITERQRSADKLHALNRGLSESEARLPHPFQPVADRDRGRWLRGTGRFWTCGAGRPGEDPPLEPLRLFLVKKHLQNRFQKGPRESKRPDAARAGTRATPELARALRSVGRWDRGAF